MSLIIKARKNKFQLPPEGKYLAKCFGVIDLGMHKNGKTGKFVSKILIAWELSHAHSISNTPCIIMQTYRASLSPTSKLRALLESWRGKNFTEEELEEFYLPNMIEESCQLTIKHKACKDNQKYRAVVSKIEPLSPEMPYPHAHHIPLIFDLDYYAEAYYRALPEIIRKKINLKKVGLNFPTIHMQN